jgi:hypothetical protein
VPKIIFDCVYSIISKLDSSIQYNFKKDREHSRELSMFKHQLD